MGQNPCLCMWPPVYNSLAKRICRSLAFWADARGPHALDNILGSLLHDFRVCEALWLAAEEMARRRLADARV